MKGDEGVSISPVFSGKINISWNLSITGRTSAFSNDKRAIHSYGWGISLKPGQPEDNSPWSFHYNSGSFKSYNVISISSASTSIIHRLSSKRLNLFFGYTANTLRGIDYTSNDYNISKKFDKNHTYFSLGTMIDFSDVIIAIILGIILFVVTVLLWNMGIMSGLRRYGEIGMRIAIGETKNHIFISLVIESLIIGIVGSLIGTILGISVTTFFESYGLDYSKGLDALSSSNFPMPNIFYPKVTPSLYFLGFIPGVLATLFGTILAGRAIYKRETAQLFKELES